jgi:hypothetical protein
MTSNRPYYTGMKILNDHKEQVDGTVKLSKWEVDLICEGLLSIIGDVPEDHPDLEVASNLHKQMNALFNLMEDKEFPYTK